MKYFTILTFLLLLTFTATAQTPINISDARAQAAGATVTIQGIATNSTELGVIRYVQDATGGIAAYPGTGSAANFGTSVTRGTLVKVTGVLKVYNNLLEMDPITSYEVVSNGNPEPTPQVITPSQLGEDNESELVKLNGVTFANGGSTFASNTSYTFTANGQSSTVFIRANHPLIGTTIPLATVNLTGICSQFNSNYQLLLRDVNDIEIASTFFITQPPTQSNISTTGFDVTWETNLSANSVVKYGTSPTSLTQTANGSTSGTSHSLSLTNLLPGTVYYVSVESTNNGVTVTAGPKIYITKSTSSGEMHIYFNKGVNPAFVQGNYAAGLTPAACEQAIINRINAAQNTIDVCVYNNNRATIVAALESAVARGVRVRYVTSTTTANEALSNPTPSFPVLKGNPDALMHNKFAIFDADDSNNCWVIMGSMNWTDTNMANDYNNMLIIQDQSLARTYRLEFEEMWGGSTATPGIFSSKFGNLKTDNTPKQLIIGDTPVQCYFSPSDMTSTAIINAVESSDNSLNFCVLTFTKNELGTAVKDAKDDGALVRGIIENIGDQGSEYDFLVQNNIQVYQHSLPGDLHHKYAIIDGTDNSSDPTVVTGSHNWSASAETSNDENTLIIHSLYVSSLFVQEFEARWCEVTAGSNCVTGIDEQNVDYKFEISPNPASKYINVTSSDAKSNIKVISVIDAKGATIESILLNNQFSYAIDLNAYPSGIYYCRIIDEKGNSATKKFVVAK
ncbi:MAG: fibronectin type III domain-containing protein [Saprospiraceae bacterium]|nr:fibronectin type III domain-containing protein [Saprospiraceae bacterium]